MTNSENRYFIVFTINENNKFNKIYLIDKKLNRLYYGHWDSNIGRHSIPIYRKEEYFTGDKNEFIIELNRTKFMDIRKEKRSELDNIHYIDFLKKFYIEQWVI